ncbi:MAG: hypothetical protein ACRET0_01565 [Steroidobacteraceae bacterium]
MLTQKSPRSLGFAILVLAMAATRFGGHLGSAWSPPDASWAVFFLAGFYLAREWRWALLALLVEAVAIDFAAIRFYGVSNYCLTAAYWFILPGYSALWLGGAWLRRGYERLPRDLGRLALSLGLSVSACFLLTQGSFYWLGGRISQPSLAGWWSNFVIWYGYFMAVTAGYVGFASLGHIALTRHTSAAVRMHVR